MFVCRPEEGTRSRYRWLWATMWLLELNSEPLEEQTVLLTFEASLHPFVLIFLFCFFETGSQNWPQTHSLPASASQALGSEVCAPPHPAPYSCLSVVQASFDPDPSSAELIAQVCTTYPATKSYKCSWLTRRISHHIWVNPSLCSGDKSMVEALCSERSELCSVSAAAAAEVPSHQLEFSYLLPPYPPPAMCTVLTALN